MATPAKEVLRRAEASARAAAALSNRLDAVQEGEAIVVSGALRPGVRMFGVYDAINSVNRDEDPFTTL